MLASRYVDCAVGGYLLEHLLDSKENRELIADFSVSNNAAGLDLESYINSSVRAAVAESGA